MDTAYVNARIRTMKSALFPQAELLRLIDRPDTGAILEDLERTPYREEIERASARFSGLPCLEEALRMHQAWSCRRVLAFARESEVEPFIRMLLARWDIQNVKTILRGKQIHAPALEILSCLVPAGGLDNAALTELVRQQDIRAVVDLLATWRIPLARPLTRQLPEYNEKRDLSLLEYALDRYGYERALAAVAGDTDDDLVMRTMFGREIDVINVRTVLKVIRDGIDPEEGEALLIHGSRGLGMDKLRGLLQAGTLEGVIRGLQGTPYQFLEKVPEETARLGWISAYEKEMERYLHARANALFLGDPLGIGIAIGYFWAKQREVTNLRTIARCRDAGMPEKEIRGELIHV